MTAVTLEMMMKTRSEVTWEPKTGNVVYFYRDVDCSFVPTLCAPITAVQASVTTSLRDAAVKDISCNCVTSSTRLEREVCTVSYHYIQSMKSSTVCLMDLVVQRGFFY